MRLKFLRLAEKGMQVFSGRLSQTLDSTYGYSMTLLSNIRSVKVSHEDWKQSVYIPLEQVANYTPADGESAK